MKIAIKHIAPWSMLIGGWLVFAPLAGAQSDTHAGHGGHAQAADPHAHHVATPAEDPHAGHMMAPVQEGSWSYNGRENPKPHTQGRWEMWPSSKNGAQFIAADALSPQERCAAVRDNDYMAVDRATRAACAGKPAPARTSPPTAPADPHAGH